MLIHPGDHVLMEEPTYPGNKAVVSILELMHIKKAMATVTAKTVQSEISYTWIRRRWYQTGEPQKADVEMDMGWCSKRRKYNAKIFGRATESL